MVRSLAAQDSKLVQIVDAALADAARRSGEWLACRPGCTQCCAGVFAISQLDAVRLQRGMVELEKSDPQRAERVRQRAQQSRARLSEDFPGNQKTGMLGTGKQAEKRFEAFANDEPCPALDLKTGLCDLYESRPMTCRTFGPPVRSEGGLGVCELCYHGATDEQIAGCEMVLDTDELESKLVREAEKLNGQSGQTIVAFCLSRPIE